MRPRRALIGAVLALLLAACQAGAPVSPGETPPSNTTSAPNPNGPSSPAEPVPSAGQEPTALDGSIAFALDSTNGSGGSTTETHQKLNVTVHLVAHADDPFTFVDSGSTFIYSETTGTDDPQTVSSCGEHQVSTGSGSGPFGPPGMITASYGDFNPEVDLTIHAPYSSTGTLTFLCNGLTSSSTTDELTESTCNTGGTGSLAGTIEPGNVMTIVPGQVIDFTCTETMAIGSGAITVSGTLTSH